MQDFREASTAEDRLTTQEVVVTQDEATTLPLLMGETGTGEGKREVSNTLQFLPLKSGWVITLTASTKRYYNISVLAIC